MHSLRLCATAAAGLTTRLLLSGLFLAASAALAAAQSNPCSSFHPMVDEVDFTGTRRVSKGILKPIVYVQASSRFRRWFKWDRGSYTCLDSADIVSDVAAIRNEYVDRGFIGVRVTGSVQRLGNRRARVVYAIREGAPVIISQVTVTGLPKAAADSAALIRYLLQQPFDDSIVDAVTDSIQSLVRDAGYARAAPPFLQKFKDSTSLTGSVTVRFAPGRLTYIDTVAVNITPAGRTPALDAAPIRTTFGVRRGAQYSARSISAGQRELSALELYRLVKVDTIPAADTGEVARDSIGLRLTLVESDRHRARTTVGWGTLDCFRTQVRYVGQDFFGLGHRLELTGRLSKIGVADPFSGLSSLCAGRVRDDEFSQLLNYYAGATVRLRGLPPIGTARWQPEVTLFSERRSSIGAYEQTTEIGLLGTSAHRLGIGLTATARYTYTDSRTRADRAVSCERFGFCRLEDVASFVLRSPQHTIGGSLQKNPLLPSDDPSSGHRWSADVKYGHASIGRQLPINFGRFVLEGVRYFAASDWLTIAVRAQLGGVVLPADRARLLPPGERFYGGGQNSVRGFGQNLLGPGSYIVNEIDTVAGPGGTTVGEARADVAIDHIAPSGGNAMWLGNVELRSRTGWPTSMVQWVLFLDVGRVWNTRDVFSVTNADARATPGFGIRLITPLGPFRLDVGYNPNNEEPGPAFFIIPADRDAGTTGRAICVSPGSDDPLVLGAGQAGSSSFCPATYRPQRKGGLLSRLSFHFSLGQAF